MYNKLITLKLKKNMHSLFPLFRTVFDLSEILLASVLQDGDCVIDATAGNGKDALRFAKLLSKKKNTRLFCLDVQPLALETTRALLTKELPEYVDSIEYVPGSHEILPDPGERPVRLIVYNLGYLPGGDKSLTTRTESTLTSLILASELIAQQGVICITCYPGHEEGAREEEALTRWMSELDPRIWNVTRTVWTNRNKAPSLILLQKSR